MWGLKKTNRYTVFFLLFVLLAGITPHEIIHLLHEHEDTHCQQSSIGTTTLDKIHTHCDFLQLQLSAFSSHSPLQLIFTEIRLQELINIVISIHSLGFHQVPNLRGPPTLA